MTFYNKIIYNKTHKIIHFVNNCKADTQIF